MKPLNSPLNPTLGLILTVLIAITPAAGHAQTQPSCSTAINTALPAIWADWTQPESIAAATAPATQPELMLGHAYSVRLSPNATMQYVAPLKSAKEGTFGGLFMLTIDKDGVYSVAVDQKAWVDVVRDGTVLKSVAHAEGQACSTIAKTVDFKLEPGHYTLQLSNAPHDASVVEVVGK